MRCGAAKETLIGVVWPWGPHLCLTGYLSARQWHSLLTAPNYRLHNRKPAGSSALCTALTSQREETTLPHSHNYDKYVLKVYSNATLSGNVR